jgi:hypothetical protein
MGFQRGETFSNRRGFTENLVLHQVALRLELGPHLCAECAHFAAKGCLFDAKGIQLNSECVELGTKGFELRCNRPFGELHLFLLAVQANAHRLQVGSYHVLEEAADFSEHILSHAAIVR